MREDWVETYLPNVCDIFDNLRKPINSSDRKKRIEGKPESELYPYYGATGQVGYIDNYLTDGEFVLIGEDGAPFFDYTRNVAYKINGKTWVNNHAHILKSFFNNDYLLHYLNQFQFRDFVTGTTRLKLTQGALKRMPVKLAPLPTQRAIVHKIETLFASLDKGIADLKKAQEQLKVYRQAVLKKAFEGELTREWREKHVKTDGRPSQKASTTAIAAEPTIEYKKRVAEGWKLIDLSEIGEIVTGNTPSKKNVKFYSSKDYNFYKPTDLEAGDIVSKSIDGLSLEGFKTGRQVPSNSILVTCIGATIGKTGLVIKEGCFNQQINAIIPFEKYCPKFIYYQAIADDFQTQIKTKASSTTLPILNKGKFSKLNMWVCKIEEQHQIVREIESRLSVCDKVEQNISEGLEKSEALRQSILKKAFEGKLLSEAEIEQCKQEADYEPAGVLLERIKSEQDFKGLKDRQDKRIKK